MITNKAIIVICEEDQGLFVLNPHIRYMSNTGSDIGKDTLIYTHRVIYTRGGHRISNKDGRGVRNYILLSLYQLWVMYINYIC